MQVSLFWYTFKEFDSKGNGATCNEKDAPKKDEWKTIGKESNQVQLLEDKHQTLTSYMNL